jgi:transposase
MFRVHLSPAEDDELRSCSHDRATDPRTRDRLEMIRLADAGWSIPHIARHLRYHEVTVRRHIKHFLTHGFAILSDQPRSDRPPTVTEADLRAVEARLDAGGSTWTTRQLRAWLAQARGVTVHPDHRRRLLHRRRLSWQRTVTAVAHKRRDHAASDANVTALGERKKAPRAG